ncbi:MAG: FAD-dependent oxidoreductase [Candidatus Cryosericum sp.]
MTDLRCREQMLDVVIVGAGVVGCATARELSQYRLSVVVCERAAEASQGGPTKANTGIVHAGYDPTPGTLMARFNVRGNSMYDRMCVDLGVHLERRGTLVVAFSPSERMHLEELLARGQENGVPGLRILERSELMELEPNLSPEADSALFAATGATVEPYELTLALAENAALNGVEFLFEHPVRSIEAIPAGWRVKAGEQVLESRFVINAAGLFADDIARMAGAGDFHIRPRLGQYLLLEDRADYDVQHPVFQVPTAMGKGIVVSRTPDGNIIAGPTADDAQEKDDLATTADGLAHVLAGARKSIPHLDARQLVAEFTGARAVIVGHDDFVVEEGARGFFNAAGIKSPGLTAAPAIAEELVALLKGAGCDMTRNPLFIPTNARVPLFRQCSPQEQKRMIAEDPRYGRIVCRCETVTEGDVVRAIHRPAGACTVDGLKFRTRAGMGRCQGGFCGPRVLEILCRELDLDPLSVTKCGPGSEILAGRLRPEGESDA